MFLVLAWMIPVKASVKGRTLESPFDTRMRHSAEEQDWSSCESDVPVKACNVDTPRLMKMSTSYHQDFMILRWKLLFFQEKV